MSTVDRLGAAKVIKGLVADVRVVLRIVIWIAEGGAAGGFGWNSMTEAVREITHPTTRLSMPERFIEGINSPVKAFPHFADVRTLR